MMTKTCFLLCALLVLAAIVCSPVLAAKYQHQLDPDNWQDVGGMCTYDRDATWTYRSNGLDVEELVGCEPPSGSDPRLSQYILNQSEDTWTDWHVEIVNGANLRGIKVWDSVELTPWVIEIYTDKLGFFAHVTTSGNPNNPMAILPGETLFVEFSYDVAGSPVTVTQYPTTWYPIPEPASMMALLMGIGAFGLGAIRRIKK
jgi:hypothetical protein